MKKVIQANYPAVLKMCRELGVAVELKKWDMINQRQFDKVQSLWVEFQHVLNTQIRIEYVTEHLLSEQQNTLIIPSIRYMNPRIWLYIHPMVFGQDFPQK